MNKEQADYIIKQIKAGRMDGRAVRRLIERAEREELRSRVEKMEEEVSRMRTR